MAIGRIDPPAADETIPQPRIRRRPAPPPAVPPLRETPDYEVGYGKPPKSAQFKPGQSGNPRGRPKKAKGVDTIIREQMLQSITVHTAAGPKRMTRAEALIVKAVEMAAKGNFRALNTLLDRYGRAVPDAPISVAEDSVAEDLNAVDQATLFLLRQQIAMEQQNGGAGGEA